MEEHTRTTITELMPMVSELEISVSLCVLGERGVTVTHMLAALFAAAGAITGGDVDVIARIIVPQWTDVGLIFNTSQDFTSESTGNTHVQHQRLLLILLPLLETPFALVLQQH